MRLHVHEWGEPSGPPVVCLHGLSGQGGRFNRLAARLGSRRVLAVDLRGHGRSDPAPPWDTATHVQDVLETAAAHGIERCDWIGFSFGGRIAAALAAWAPERVDRLCLLDPALHVPPAECLDRAVVELEELSFGSVDEAIDTELAAGTLPPSRRGARWRCRRRLSPRCQPFCSPASHRGSRSTWPATAQLSAMNCSPRPRCRAATPSSGTRSRRPPRLLLRIWRGHSHANHAEVISGTTRAPGA